MSFYDTPVYLNENVLKFKTGVWMKGFKSVATASLYILALVAMMVFLFGYNKTISSVEKEGKLTAYSTMKIKGVNTNVAEIITTDKKKFKVGYSCLNGKKEIGSNISLIITERVTTVAFMEFKRDTATTLSSDICIRYKL